MDSVRTIAELIVPVELYEDWAATLTPRFFRFSSDGVAAKISSTSHVVGGILLKFGEDELDGDIVDAALPGAGLQEITLGDTVAFLGEVTHDNAGRAVPATGSDTVHGRVLKGGVVGDVVPLLFATHGKGFDTVIATAAEINVLAGVTPGTTLASSALVCGATGNLDALVLADGGLSLGSGAGTPVTATAAELNKTDQSANVEAVTAAGALAIGKTESKITGPASSTYAVTLAAPTEAEVGRLKIITMIATTSTNAVTLALTQIVGGTQASSASFDAAGETLVLLAIRVAATTYKWLVLKEYGVTLS